MDERKRIFFPSVWTVQFPALFLPLVLFPGREESVGAVEGFVDFRQVQAVGQGQEGFVHGSTADDEIVLPGFHGLLHGFDAVVDNDGVMADAVILLMGQDPVRSAGQDAGQAFEGLAPHEHRMAHGEGFKTF